VSTFDEDSFAHYGTPRKSGRYPWGSGGDETANNRSFLGYVEGLRKQGLSEPEIARGIGISTGDDKYSTTQLRAQKTIAINQIKNADITQAQRLKDTGMSNVAIGKEMGINESSVRSLLAPSQKNKVDQLHNTADMLRKQVAEKEFVDVGVGVERHIGITRGKLNTSIAILKEEGYKVHYVKVEQLGTGHQTTVQVLTKPDVPYSEVFKRRGEIKQVTDFTEDGGDNYGGIHPPVSISSKRVAIKYAEQGGSHADGVVYVRPGVDDVSLGGSRYAQVRIAVDGTHYLKGMAMYKDDLPKGVDLEFHTNKSDTGKKHDAMKKMGEDPENPFGAIIDRQHGVMNIVNEEGAWDQWSRNLSSQFLSKQSPSLAKSQLDMTYERKKNELDEIASLTNPAVRKRLLDAHAESIDSAAVHLKAAGLPKTANHVILPFDSVKENEIYAPNYRNGQRVVLVRHPHGGTFEIPELTVNNRNPAAKAALGNAKDAVGIHHKVAEKLSGADFDGDTVLVIPNDHGKVKTSNTLAGLKDFDPKTQYKAYEGMKPMSARTKGFEMGDVSNLITDMTIRGASNVELARAVRHSMVVIDAEKHHLNYKQSAIDNGIKQLKLKYQSTPGKTSLGASTLISRASARQDVAERKQNFTVDPATGQKIYTPTGRTRTDAKGNVTTVMQRSKKLAETTDAHTLSSGQPIEKVYAEHSNKLKALANQARKESVTTKTIPYSPSAATHYAKEVASLNSKLNIALKNAPLERQAQILANAAISAKRRAMPDMDDATLKKLKFQEMTKARLRTGAKKELVEISPSEWDAIQAGAVSNAKLTSILSNTDLEHVKKLATPKVDKVMTNAKKSRAEAMLKQGYTQAEVAEALGVGLTTLKSELG